MSRYAALMTIATRAIEKQSTKRDGMHLESALLFRGDNLAQLDKLSAAYALRAHGVTQ